MRRENFKDFPRAELLKFETDNVIDHAIEKATDTVDK